MNSGNWSVEDVLSDERFLAWYYKTDADKATQWQNELATNPLQKKRADEAVQLLSALVIREKPVDSSRATEAFLEKISEPRMAEADEAPQAVVHSMRRPLKRWWMAAAVVLLLVSAGIYMFSQPAKETLQTVYGEVRTEVLPDGSSITLNANSSISYHKDFENKGDREVWVDGEAFFQVQQTAARNRFIVHTGQFDVIVTGTQFNVNNRSNAPTILLQEGSVTLQTGKGESMNMTPGDYVIYQNDRLEQKSVSAAKVLAWKDRKFIFEKTAMQEVAAGLTAYYGIPVKFVHDSVAAKTVSGIMPNDNLDVFLQSLEATQEYEITKNDQEVLIRCK